MRLQFISVAMLVLAGCAQEQVVGPTSPVVVANSTDPLTAETKVVCHRETSIGSQMIHSVCETEQSAADRQALQERLIQAAQRSGPQIRAAGGTP